MINAENPWGLVGWGNHFFIYSFLRLLAEKLNLQLNTTKVFFPERGKKHIGVEYKFEDIHGKNNTGQEKFFLGDSDAAFYKNIDCLVDFLQDKNYHIISTGYFPNFLYWEKYQEKVKKYFSDFIGERTSYSDNCVAIHLRNSLQDPKFKVKDEYYLDILDNLGCEKIFLFADNFDRHDNLIEKIKRKAPETVLMDLNAQNSLKELTRFKNLICSQGTFSFWAAFLSSAQKVYMPITDTGPNNLNSNLTNYFIEDPHKYTYINC